MIFSWAAAQGSYDLVVFGGTPQGVAAAVSAARSGLTVALVEPSPQVGGVITRSWLTLLDMSRDSEGKSWQQGIFEEFRSLAKARGGAIEPARAEAAFLALLNQAGVAIFLEAVPQDLESGPNQVTALQTSQGEFRAPYFIDASDTAVLAAQAGATFSFGREDTGLDATPMAASLSFRLTGVDWNQITRAAHHEAQTKKNGSGASGPAAWGFSDLSAGYTPSDPERFRLRGLNLVHQEDNSVLVNALWIYQVDPRDPESYWQAHQDAATEAGRVTEYLRQARPDLFGSVQLVEVAPELYIRESRHLTGLYQLKPEELIYGCSFPDGIAIGGYPLDGQVYLPGEDPYLLGNPAPYAVPFRTLVPVEVKNLLVVSQAASFTAAAAFSARVAPLQMALGQAAGNAAAIAKSRGLGFIELASDPEFIASLRTQLVLDNARLPDVKAQACPRSEANQEALLQLLQQTLLTTPYYIKGGLYPGAPAGLYESLTDLGHLLRARAPEKLATWQAVKSQLTTGYRDLTGDDLVLIQSALDLGPKPDPGSIPLARYQWATWLQQVKRELEANSNSGIVPTAREEF